jgi:outer membrane receptor for ferrienterochelin and colicins
MADFTINKIFYKNYTLMAGIRNLFNVTRLANTAINSGVGHSSGGNVPMSYGRSYFMGITAQLSKK